MPERSQADRLLGGGGSNTAGDLDVCLLLSVVSRHVNVSATGQSFVQRSATECNVSLCLI